MLIIISILTHREVLLSSASKLENRDTLKIPNTENIESEEYTTGRCELDKGELIFTPSRYII